MHLTAKWYRIHNLARAFIHWFQNNGAIKLRRRVNPVSRSLLPSGKKTQPLLRHLLISRLDTEQNPAVDCPSDVATAT